MAGIEEMRGLLLTGSVTDLTPLSSLRRLGWLNVSITTDLVSLHGLENVVDPAAEDEPATLTVHAEENAALADLSALSMPRLRGLDLSGGNPSLVEATLGPIRELDYLVVDEELGLSRLSATALVAIHDKLEVGGNLCEVDLPALQELGSLIVAGFPSCWPQEEQDALLAQTGHEPQGP
ncbi:MAG: hypothetical protein HYS27_15015 [Deltaproteobacteria bacterium]|nr:hypothetical protein [Deltaproteobacteria bacterium]